MVVTLLWKIFFACFHRVFGSRGEAGKKREREGPAGARNILLVASEMQEKPYLLFLRERVVLSISEAGGPDFYNLLHFHIYLPEVGSVKSETLRPKYRVGKCPENGTGRGIHLNQSVVIFSTF